MGTIQCVCISKERKASSVNIHRCIVTQLGMENDVHYGTKKSPVSILPYEEISKYFEEKKEPILYGRFGENLVIKGIDWGSLKKGDRLAAGDVVMEIVRIGAASPASEQYQGFKVCTPMEPYFVFCRVIREGFLEEQQEIRRC